MFLTIIDFLTSVPLWEVLLILFAKIIEVTLSTLRMIYINKGYRTIGTVLALAEILLWVFIASRVIVGVAEAPMKGILYSIGFATGVYIGSIIENKLAVGKIYVQAVIMREEAHKVVKAIRDAGYGVTVMSAQGKIRSRKVLMIFTSRKNKDTLVELINSLDDDALIVVNEVSLIQGGYSNSFRRIAK